jgi:hypothetical protein
MTDIKTRQRRIGRRLTLTELNREAVAAGYASFDELKEAAISLKKSAPAKKPEVMSTAATAPLATTPSQDEARRQRISDKNAREAERLARVAAEERKQRVAAQRALREKDAETELRMLAMRSGINDVDYALTMLRRKISGMTKQELAAFDEAAYFSTVLRTEKPFLYAVQDIPVTTSSRESAPDVGSQTRLPGGKVDATKLSKDEYERELQKRGIRSPSLGIA